MKKLAFAVAAAMGVAGPAQAGPQGITSGMALLAHCLTPEPDWIGFCNGYVQAVYDTSAHSQTKACIPAGTTRADAANLVVERLAMAYQAEGEGGMLMSGSAGAVVQAILHDAYPCD